MVVPLSPTVVPQSPPDSFSFIRQSHNDERRNQIIESQDSIFLFEFRFEPHPFLFDSFFLHSERSTSYGSGVYFSEEDTPTSRYLARIDEISLEHLEVTPFTRWRTPIWREEPSAGRPVWREEPRRVYVLLLEKIRTRLHEIFLRSNEETDESSLRWKERKERKHQAVSKNNPLRFYFETDIVEEEIHWNIRRIYHIKDRPWSQVPFYLTLDPRRTVFHIKDRPEWMSGEQFSFQG